MLSISDDLHQKSQRWSVVEPLISEIDQKLMKTANYIQNNRGDKSFDAPIDKQLESELDASNTIRDNLMELEHLVLPLGHQGGYYHRFLSLNRFCSCLECLLGTRVSSSRLRATSKAERKTPVSA